MERSRLEMEFKDQLGKKFTLTIDDPRPDVTEEEVRTAMENVVNRNIFFTDAGDIVSIVGARLITTTIEELRI
ncbi:MAG: DUF2922 domain-containing protein [Tissierellia bacterium]|nr:DUF2922 domain-containing protein [Tissierellia bacterium]